ncbi:thiamine pyrophosphokinase [Spiroplasma chinense]|uniref:Thiamine diphosphokinase n=1 Tax=Spiroplasma chinense TaxID=216932 RepID=A0A5B9Y5V3_9MOLU|nr:thiamine diphosphokinase [Spiroplasma chinense]QEH62183.1 thiamine pyrophosphokinase [Spiroplasma chinense]
MKSKCLIVTCENKLNLSYYLKDYFIIGVERGCLDLISKGIEIDYAISDFDHVTNEEFELIKANAKELEVLSNEKDFLDGKEAIQKAYSLGATEVLFVANPTKRNDMNLSVIEFCAKDRVKVLSDTSITYCLQKGENILEFEKYQDYTYITLFPIHQTNVTIEGLKYEASELQLLPYSTRAYSNCFIPYVDGKITTSNAMLVIFGK